MSDRRRNLLILDVDGTLVEPRDGSVYRASADDWQLRPDRAEVIASLRPKVQIALATNQGGVAFGYFTANEMLHEMQALAHQLDLAPSSVFMCIHHPTGTIPLLAVECPNRKPAPGMLLAIMAQFDIPAERTLMVGDRNEDKGAAAAAGCRFTWAERFFNLHARRLRGEEEAP